MTGHWRRTLAWYSCHCCHSRPVGTMDATGYDWPPGAPGRMSTQACPSILGRRMWAQMAMAVCPAGATAPGTQGHQRKGSGERLRLTVGYNRALLPPVVLLGISVAHDRNLSGLSVIANSHRVSTAALALSSFPVSFSHAHILPLQDALAPIYKKHPCL